MPGFFLSNMPIKAGLDNFYDEQCVSEEMRCGRFWMKRNTLDKFMEDKLFVQDDEMVVVTEGVILNSRLLMQENESGTWLGAVKIMAREDGTGFFNRFRGSFSGAAYFKDEDEWVVYTNHIGDKTIFYHIQDERIIIGSQVNYLLDALKELGIPCTFDEKAASDILTFGYMEGENTYAKEIKRLLPGHYIRLKDNQLEIKPYFMLRHNRHDLSGLSREEMISGFDERFRRAVALEYDKDLEYGYRHLTDLSGGLDSRMNAWVATDLGYEDITCTCFAQSGSSDHLIATQLAEAMGNPFIFKSLNDAGFMRDIDTMVWMLAGLSTYSGSTGSNQLLRALNMREYGLIHSGQLGDVVLGSFYGHISEKDDCGIGGLYSTRLNNRITAIRRALFPNKEIYMFYVRGFQGALSSHMIRQQYTETVSPFTDVETMEYALSIPLEYRIGHSIYAQWVRENYPKAAAIPWAKTGKALTKQESKSACVRWLKGLAGHYKGRIVHFFKRNRVSNTGMNPMDYWNSNIPALATVFAEYFAGHINDLPKELVEDSTRLFNEGIVEEKTQVLTLLSANQLYFNNGRNSSCAQAMRVPN